MALTLWVSSLCLLGVAGWSLADVNCSAGARPPMTVLGPEVAIPGQISAVQVTLHDTLEHNVTLIFSCPKTSNSEPLAQNTVKIQEHGTITLAIPCQVSGLCLLETLLDCPLPLLEAESRANCSGLVSAPVRVVGSVRDVIIRPAAGHYHPGDELSFWVLALDRDLRIASDVLANIYVRDPSGIKVKLWEQILFTTGGAKQYSLSLSPYARFGLWTLEVVIEGEIFSRQVNVSSQTFSTNQKIAIAQRHYVELRFMSEMKKSYKPGLPFVGMIESVSSEKSIRVRVKVLDDITAIYSQDIEMVKGEGMFVVPAIISDSDHIVIQAELVSVDGKEIDSHYILAKEVIKKWTSPSDCYLLIEGIQHTLEPQQPVHATVISSCPCTERLHYMVVTEGHVTSWSKDGRHEMTGMIVGQTIFENSTSTSVCKFNFTFSVDSTMAPVSNLVVYYVDQNQTVVADLASFRVNLSNNKISTVFDSSKQYAPDEKIEMQIFAEHESTVCLIGGREGDGYFEHRFPYKELDLSQAGVSLFDSAPCSSVPAHHPKHRHHHYSVFPDVAMDTTWLWRCFNYTKDMSSRKLKISAPSRGGRYYLRSLVLSSTSSGLRYSEPADLTVFSPLNVEFTLPEIIRVGEVLQVDVKVENNVNDCVDVSAILTLNGGALFFGTNQAYIGEKLRLGPQGATSIVVKFVSSTPGYNNFTAEVSGYISDSCQAQKNPHGDNLQPEWSQESLGTFVHMSSLLVMAEGQIKTRTESAYFCANEQFVTIPASDNRYKWIPAPRNKDGVFVTITSSSDVTIVLSGKPKTSPQMYTITLGLSKSWITRGKHAHGVYLTHISVPNLLSSDKPSVFWLTWDSGLLTVGRQWEPHNQTLLQWPLDKKFKVNNLGFKADFEHKAQFRVWNYNEEAGFSQVLHLDVPHSILPGTERGLLLLAGGLAIPSYLPLYYPVRSSGPSLGAPTHLLRQLPRALAEHTSLSTLVSSFAPILLLDVDPSLSEYKTDLLKHIEQNLQTLFQYKLQADFSFGDHYNKSSLWMTLSVLELFTDIQSYVGIDPEIYTSIKRTVQNHQTPDGSFTDPNVADLYVDVEITAFALSVLVQVGVDNDYDTGVISRARTYLEQQDLANISDSFTLSIVSYALVRTNSQVVEEWLSKLNALSVNEEGDFGWQRGDGGGGGEGSDREGENGNGLVRDYQASLYCLLIQTKLKNLEQAEPVAKYLTYRIHVLDRHSELLYLALKSFAQFSTLADDTHRSLTVSLATSNMELTDTLELRTHSPPCPLELPSLPTKVFVYSTGAGCATIQGLVTYSTYSVSAISPLLDIGSEIVREFLPGRPLSTGKYPRLLVKTCVRWKGHKTPPGGVKVEVSLFSGFRLDSIQHVNSPDVTYNSRGDDVSFMIPNIKSSCVTCLEYYIVSHYTLESLRPAFARAYPASQPYLDVGTFFHTSLDSPLTDGATPDDFETWFGANYTEPHNLFQDQCECHRICHNRNSNHRARNHTSVQSTTPVNTNSTTTQATNVKPEMKITKTQFDKKMKEIEKQRQQDKTKDSDDRITSKEIAGSVEMSEDKSDVMEKLQKTVEVSNNQMERKIIKKSSFNVSRLEHEANTTQTEDTSKVVKNDQVEMRKLGGTQENEQHDESKTISTTPVYQDEGITLQDSKQSTVNRDEVKNGSNNQTKEIVINSIKQDLTVTFAPRIIIDKKRNVPVGNEDIGTTKSSSTDMTNIDTKDEGIAALNVKTEAQKQFGKKMAEKVKKYNSGTNKLKTSESNGLLTWNKIEAKKGNVDGIKSTDDSHMTEKDNDLKTAATNKTRQDLSHTNKPRQEVSVTEDSNQNNKTTKIENRDKTNLYTTKTEPDDKHGFKLGLWNKTDILLERTGRKLDLSKPKVGGTGATETLLRVNNHNTQIRNPAKRDVPAHVELKTTTPRPMTTQTNNKLMALTTQTNTKIKSTVGPIQISTTPSSTIQPHNKETAVTKIPSVKTSTIGAQSKERIQNRTPNAPATTPTFLPSSPTIDTTKLHVTTQHPQLNLDSTTPNQRSYFHLIQSHEITITKPIGNTTMTHLTSTARPKQTSPGKENQSTGMSSTSPRPNTGTLPTFLQTSLPTTINTIQNEVITPRVLPISENENNELKRVDLEWKGGIETNLDDSNEKSQQRGILKELISQGKTQHELSSNENSVNVFDSKQQSILDELILDSGMTEAKDNVSLVRKERVKKTVSL
uniref:C3 and PZP-like alpha-2-macroglobulin domain-containing protein 8 n=1 Tax=Cacopsylla melanoneura TaxID=428564 RepID=A0A8D9A5S6_9HEMI